MTTPPIDWFRDPGFTDLTPLTVTPEGRVSGHLAGWRTEHMSFPGRRITPPRSASDYSFFHVGAATVLDGDTEREISVGRLVMGSGHADTGLGHRETADFYDNSSTVAAVCCVGDDAHGIWFSGAVMPDLDEVSVRRFRACALSGDWRRVGTALELVACLAVGTPGFPIPRSRVASGAPMALVAAGALTPPPMSFARRVDPAWSASSGAVVLDYDTLAEAIASRLDQRRVAGELSVAHAALVAELDDTPTVVAALLAEVDDSPQRAAALLAELDEGSGGVGPKGLTA